SRAASSPRGGGALDVGDDRIAGPFADHHVEHGADLFDEPWEVVGGQLLLGADFLREGLDGHPGHVGAEVHGEFGDEVFGEQVSWAKDREIWLPRMAMALRASGAMMVKVITSASTETSGPGCT